MRKKNLLTKKEVKINEILIQSSRAIKKDLAYRTLLDIARAYSRHIRNFNADSTSIDLFIKEAEVLI
jgi:hypothetical protein